MGRLSLIRIPALRDTSVSSGMHGDFRSWGYTGCAINLPAIAALDPLQTSALAQQQPWALLDSCEARNLEMGPVKRGPVDSRAPTCPPQAPLCPHVTQETKRSRKPSPGIQAEPLHTHTEASLPWMLRTLVSRAARTGGACGVLKWTPALGP